MTPDAFTPGSSTSFPMPGAFERPLPFLKFNWEWVGEMMGSCTNILMAHLTPKCEVKECQVSWHENDIQSIASTLSTSVEWQGIRSSCTTDRNSSPVLEMLGRG